MDLCTSNNPDVTQLQATSCQNSGGCCCSCMMLGKTGHQKLTMRQLFSSIQLSELYLAKRLCHHGANWLQSPASVPSLWHPRCRCRPQYMLAAYTEPICLYPCSYTNALIGAGQDHRCQPVIDVCKFLIVCSNLMMFPWGAQACTPEILELTVV